jgi:hypothetical protein
MANRIQSLVIVIFFIGTPRSLLATDLGLSSSIGIANSPSQAATSQISDLQITGKVNLADLYTGWRGSSWSFLTSLSEQTVGTKDRANDIVSVRTLKTTLLGLGIGHQIEEGRNSLYFSLIGGKSSGGMRLNDSSSNSSSIGTLDKLNGQFAYVMMDYRIKLNRHASLDLGAKIGSHHISIDDKSVVFTGQQVDGKQLQLTQDDYKPGSKLLPKTLRVDSIQVTIGITIAL